MSIAELRRTFFVEVAPVLGINALTPAPSIWTGFNGDEVVNDISRRLTRRRESLGFRVVSSMWAAMGRGAFRSIWADLERELIEQEKKGAL